MKYPYFVLALLLTLASCASKTATQKEPELASVQIMDRNGFAETVSSKDRLANFKKVDFETPQPYQKVLRVYGKDGTGKTRSVITSYHDNGHIWQSINIIDGRAQGNYSEWHPNGQLKLDAHIIEGIADLTDAAQSSWVFEGESKVLDTEGHLIAQIQYAKGVLDGISYYYFPEGKVFKEVPFIQGQIHGTATIFNKEGTIVEKSTFEKGIKVGESVGFFEEGLCCFKENYNEKGLLLTAAYFDKQGTVIAEIKNGAGFQAIFEEQHLTNLVEYNAGLPDGLLKTFDKEKNLHSTCRMKAGKKEGEEIIYNKANPSLPRLSLTWHEDALQGQAKTWYEDGMIESQRELNGNKKEGLAFAWYKNGALMLMEEYANDLLTKGTYYKKNDKKPISSVENGKGIATLFDGKGNLLKKINYEKGKPELPLR